MKKFIALAALLFVLSGCKIHYVQLFKTNSERLKPSENFYTFENDTLRIDYTFWAENGRVVFRIYNKSDRPIYIDWRKSSYISKDKKIDYWSDVVQTKHEYEMISYHNGIFFPKIAGYSSIGSSTSITTRPERITFIPPRSYYDKIGYKIISNIFETWAQDYLRTSETRHDNPKEQTTIYTKKFTKDNSPLTFRNFLTLSYKEDFSSEFYSDSEFYLKEVVSMDRRHFSVMQKNDGSKKEEHFFYKTGTDFYRNAD